jgi:hypothetical protein
MDGLPGWATVSLTQACRDENWLPLCDILHSGIKQQLEGNLVSKRFSELTETEQAQLVEHHYRELRIRGNKEHLDPFVDVMNRAVDEQLLQIILQRSLNKQTKARSGFNEDKKGGDGGKEDIHNTNNSSSDSSSVADVALQASSKEHAADENNLEFLMGEISSAVIELLERSEPALRNTLTMFLNKPLPSQIRIYIWSKSLRLDQQRLEDGTALFAGRLAPSVDLILSRRCHALLDTSFSVVSSRANASFVKTIVTNFMRLTGMKVPDTASDNFDNMEHLVYLLIPLLVILRSNVHDLLRAMDKDNKSGSGGSGSISRSQVKNIAAAGEGEEGSESGSGRGVNEGRHALLGSEPTVPPGTVEFFEDNYTTNIGNKINATKRINIMENALYSLLEPRFLGLMELAKQERKKKKKGEDDDQTGSSGADALSAAAAGTRIKNSRDEDAVSGTFSFVEKAPGMGQALSLLAAKDPGLYSLLMRLEMYHQNASDGEGGGSAALGIGATAASGRMREHEITYFVLSQATNWTDFMNELLLRGLSGLLNLEVTLFIWDQGFVTDFGAMLPLVLVSLTVGAGPELRSLVSYKNIVETFISHCRAVTVEQMQRLLMEHCSDEMKEFGEMAPQTTGRDDLVMTDMFRRAEMNM